MLLQAFWSLCGAVGACLMAWLALFVLYDAGQALRRRFAAPVSPRKRGGGRGRVLVTGCDTGFGNMVAKRLHGQGWRIAAGCLTQAAADKLNEAHGDRMEAFVLDVTSQPDVEAAVKRLKDTGNDLWAVINNAGIASGCYVEWNSVADYQRVLDVNFLGAVRATKAVLPFLHASGGRVINVVSICGFITFPGASAYCASKHAMEAYSDALRREMGQWGVSVVVLEPGFFSTNIVTAAEGQYDRTYRALPPEVRQRWGDDWWEKQKKMFGHASYVSKPPKPVVDAMQHAVTSPFPQSRMRIGWDAKFLFPALAALPTWLFDLLCRAQNLGLAPAALRKRSKRD